MVRIAACFSLFAAGIAASSQYPPMLHSGNATGEIKDIGGGSEYPKVSNCIVLGKA
jgi:hypothetical protein